ncbi:MAG: DNRLRE domain-containing protein [Planctomycetes bacterium]|nr:DNRLRE domain-containing protein [Planctomycetota bacterium]
MTTLQTVSFVCALLLVCAGTGEAQTTVVPFQDGSRPTAAYQGTEDTVIKEQVPTLNLGQLPKTRVTTADLGGGATWTLIRWDLSGHIPPGVVVTDVQLTFYVDPDDPGPTIPIYPLLRPWVEGNGTQGGTWNTYDGVNNWQTAGAEGALDRGSTSVGDMPGAAGFQTATLSPAGIAVVQGWVDNPTTNNGFILRGGSSDGVDYGSRDNASVNLHPQIQVSYELPPFGGGGGGGGASTDSFRDGEAGYSGTEDTYLRGDKKDNNQGDKRDIRVDGNGRNYRSLLQWNLSSIPTNATVTAVSLTLYCNNSGGSGDLREMLRDWDEGDGSKGSGADWRDYNAPGANWGAEGANGGADRGAVRLGLLPATNKDSFQTGALNSTGIAVVQGWISTPANNNGFGIYPTTNNESRWRSRDHGTVEERPQITISYTTPGGGGGTGTKSATSNGSWNDPLIWTPNGVPIATERAIIDGTTVTLGGGGTHAVARIEVVNGGRLEISNGTLASSGLVAVLPTSTLSVQGGTLQTLSRTLVIASTLSISGGSHLLGALPLWVGASSTFAGSGGLLAADSAGIPMDVSVHGTLQAAGLTIRNPHAAGFHVSRHAQIQFIRNCRFEGVAAGAGSRLLSIEQDTFCLSAPNNFFDAVAAGQYSVRVNDTDSSTPDDVAITFEDRGDAISGAGADPARELEENGGSVNWVYSAPDSTSGTSVGFPQVAYDLSTFAYYATYVAFSDVNAAGDDRIHVFDPNGEGLDSGYYFEIPESEGNIVRGFWWDQQGAARVVWVTTTTGRLFRFTNPGAGAGAIAPDVGFPTTIANATFSTPPLTADASLVYAAGTVGGAPRIFALDSTTGALAWSASSGLPDPVTSELGSESQSGVTTIFAGGGQIQPGGTVFFTEDFDASAGSFAYQDDTFRGTSNPGGASGDHSTTGGQTGGRVRVTLGPNSANMSGGWQATVTVPGASPSLVEVSFAYRLISGGRYEFDEFQQIMASVDGVTLSAAPAPNDFVFQYVGDGNGDPQLDSGWVTATFQVTLTPGPHQLTLGGYSNKSTEGSEVAYAQFDDVVCQTLNSSGRIYRLNTQTQLVEAEDGTPTGPISGSVFPAFGFGLFAVDENGSVHGIDSTTMAPLAGWPVQTGTPLRSDVWMDFFLGQVFFGNESGQVFGYSFFGLPLAGWPLSPFGTASPVRASPLFDSGLLWTSNTDGRVVAIDTSAATVVSPDYRFGTESSRISQDTSSRVTLSTHCGQYLVLLPLADPTP